MFRFHGRVKNSVGLAVRAAFFNGRGGQYNSPNTTGGFFESAYFYAVRTSTITQSRGAGTPTETRATVATVMGYAADATIADGQTLLTVASGELRFQGARRVSEGVWSNVDADGAPILAATTKGAVVEAEATNIALQSNAFATTWVAIGTPSATQNATGPDGATSAWTMTDNDAGAREGLYQTVLLTADVYTFSIFVAKTAGATTFPIIYCYAGTTIAPVTIDTNNGVCTAWSAYTGLNIASGLSASCESFNDDFWRIQYTFTATAASWEFDIYPAATANATQSTGAPDNTVQGSAVFYGAQLELGSYATTYQATTTAAVTRNKDVLDDQVASNLTGPAGTVAFTWTPSHDPSGTIALCGGYEDANNSTQILHDGTKYIFRKKALSDYDAELTAAFVSGTPVKVAIRWGANGTQIAVDGVLGTANANAVAARLGTRWQWGADGNGGQQAGAAFKEMYLTPRTMSDAELQAITV